MPFLNTSFEEKNVNVSGALTFSVVLNSDLLWNKATKNVLGWVGFQFRNGSLMRLICSKDNLFFISLGFNLC